MNVLSRVKFHGIVSLTALTSLGVIGAVPPARAADAPSADELESVTVTARKREETLQDAPVAITAISAKQIEQYNLTQMEDIASLAGGGVIISKNAVSPTISIRGVSSDSTNAGFDQSVGIIIDGVFYDRSRWTQMGFFDVAQVEVLKGPQSLYFGKSTVAGAVVMTTASPTKDFQAGVTGGYEVEGQEWYGQGTISGPLTDTVGARLAMHVSDMRGWLYNDAPGLQSDHFGGEKQYDARLSMDWRPSDTSTLLWKAQGNHFSDDGPATRAQLFNCRGPSTTGTTITGIQADIPGAFYPTADDCRLDDRTTVYPAPQNLEYGHVPYSVGDAYLTSLKADWKLGAFKITSVTGVNTYEQHDETGYVSSQGLITALEAEHNTAWSQELRALSDFAGPVNVLVGADYEHSDFKFRNTSQILLSIPDPRNGRATSQDHVATQTSKTASAFAEITWEIVPKLSLSAGARYTDVRKDANYDLTFVNENFNLIFPFPFWLPEGTALSNNFKDTNVSPQATLQWKPTEDLNLFASYKTGFLPGGFSLGATPQAGLTLDDFLFQSEKVKGWEVGLKKLLLDRRLAVDVVAYDYKFTNLQVNLYVPATASFIVGNAGEARTRGVELSGRWQATEGLSLHGLATYNDGKFQDYRTSCYTLQTAAQGCDAATGTQDMSGKPLPRSPQFTVALGGVQTLALSGNWGLSLALDAYYSDEYSTEQTDNPFLYQPSYVRLDASLDLESHDHRWRASVYGRNLTNKAIASFGATRGFTNDGLVEIERLRTVAFEITRRF